MTDGDPAIDPTLDDPSVAGEGLAAVREGPGCRLGPYRLLQLIGEGGFGSVFLAEQERPVQRQVAVKIVKLGMDTRRVIARFESERQALALMDHPHIAKVLDAGATETGRPYFVMELCRGEPIHTYCDRNNLAIADRLELFVQVCLAVQHAHQKGIIHRDLKPGNVLVATQDGRPHAKVIDFGIAKATAGKLTEKTLFTERGQWIGTPEYMSPEQAEGSLDIDTRTDVYSLGVLLYELLTGTTPFDARGLRSAGYAEVQRIIREVEPPKPSTRLGQSAQTLAAVAARRHTEPRRLGTLIRGDLDWIAMKCLEKDRTRRYETTGGLAADVRRYLSNQPVAAGPPSAAYVFRKFVRRHRGQVAAAGLLLLALLAGITGTTGGLLRANAAAAAERAARLDAQEQRAAAIRAAEAERAASEQARKRLGQVEKANDILISVFESLDPARIARSDRPLQAILVENLDKAVAQIEGESIGDPLAVASVQHRFGASLLALGAPEKAIVLLERARTARAAGLGPTHLYTLASMNNLAAAYQAAGKHALAISLGEETLQLQTSTLGPDHVNTLATMSNLALSLWDTGKHDRAVPLFEETLRRRRAVLGPTHPDTLMSMSNLASAYHAAGRTDQGRATAEEALALKKQILGAEHPSTLNTMNTLASFHRAAGRHDQAVPLLEETLAIQQRRLGPDHPNTLATATNLGVALWSLKQLDRSIPLFEDILRRSTIAAGPGHPDTVTVAVNLGVNYRDAGRLEEAIPILESGFRAAAESRRLDFAGPQLLEAYALAGRSGPAAALAQELLAQARRDLPPGGPALAGQLATLARSLLQAGAFEGAEGLLRECLAIRQEREPEAWSTFNTMSMLGGALLGQGRHAEAEPLLLRGAEGMLARRQAIPPQGRARLPEALDRLGELYERTGRTEEAARWRAEREALGGDGAPPGR